MFSDLFFSDTCSMYTGCHISGRPDFIAALVVIELASASAFRALPNPMRRYDFMIETLFKLNYLLAEGDQVIGVIKVDCEN